MISQPFFEIWKNFLNLFLSVAGLCDWWCGILKEYDEIQGFRRIVLGE